MRRILLFTLLCVSIAAQAALPLMLNGETLPENTDFTRIQCGTLTSKKTMAEISGIACSRVTPGFLWMESDNISTQIIATTEKGDKCYLKLRLKLTAPRWDWEDLCGGVYNGKNYIFVAAIGDNNEDGGEYRIHYVEEPDIPTTKIDSIRKVSAKSIVFQYPEGKRHNAEALMYDNVEQVFYIITKKYYQPCQVFSLPMSLDYGNEVQTLSYVCDLGVQSDLGEGSKADYGFHLVTGADISPDGKYILIKNHNNTTVDRKEYGYSWTLLWKRMDGESVSEALKRQPEVIQCYEEEWQGEAICWLDSTTFYTTSDDDGNPPVYKYMNQYAPSQGVESVRSGTDKSPHTLVFVGNTLYIRGREGLYTMDGQLVK